MHARRAGIALGVAVAGVALAAGALAQTVAAPAPENALAAYVAAPDVSFEWRVHARYQRRGAALVELRLHSQTWRNVLWKHQLMLIKPRRAPPSGHAVLVVGGGRWRPEYDGGAASGEVPEEADRFIWIAERLNAVVAVLGQVPFQPLFDLTEDRLIAHTFEQYLRTGEPDWPLLLPMVKAAVRAMDASSAEAAREWDMALERFTILGGSKRGWTTWLVGAVDDRAVALVPAVIDALNMAEHFEHQIAVWGMPSEEIRPYTELGLHEVLGSDTGAALRRIVDPYAYRDALRQPKLVVLATNDRYFPASSANLYWDELRPPKYLLYLPNEQHSIDDYRRLVASLRAIHESADSGTPLPRFEWEYRFGAEALELCVRAEPRAARLRLWSAASADRDLRDSTWTETGARGGGAQTLRIARPHEGILGVFAEAQFGRGRAAYTLSTNLAVIARDPSADRTPRPAGTAGICAAPD